MKASRVRGGKVMFRKMQICTDLSPASNALIQCVEALKDIGTREVVLAHVLTVAGAEGFEGMLLVETEPILARQKEELEKLGLQVVVESELGDPATVLEEIAEKHDVSAILIGAHGKGVIQAVALGSVSTQLLRKFTRPLLLDRLDFAEEGRREYSCRKIFTRVLFPTDFSETAERALDYLGKIALETGSSVTLLHVMEPKGEDAEENRRHEEECWYLLESKKRRLERLGASEVSIDLVHGKPGDEIVARTKKGAFSSVVMGGQGKGLLTEIFLGSTANHVARYAELPVLFVPAAAIE